jgi:serine/threonine protein kinase
MSTEGRLFADKFRILDQIAQGDLASVYQAIEMQSGEVCTLKLFNWDLSSNGSLLGLLQQESANVDKLRHPNIMPVGRVDRTAKGQLYAVRTFIEGRNLEDVIRLEAPLELRRACAIGRQIASALEASHHAGILHGDLKPSNVLLVEENSGSETVKVLGFGTFALKQDRFIDLARLAMNELGHLMGSAQYVSPERAIGTEPDALDGRSDLYSLGVIIYQMLSAETPFRAANAMEILLDHLFNEPRPLHEHSDLDIPEALDTLVMRTLARNRKDRPASATVLVDQLQAWQKYEGVSEAPAPLLATTGKDGETIAVGTPSDSELLGPSRLPFVHIPKEPTDEPVLTSEVPGQTSGDRQPEASGPPVESWWSSSAARAPEANVTPEADTPSAHAESGEGRKFEEESVLSSRESADEQKPVSRLPFASVPMCYPEEFATTVQLPVQDAASKASDTEKHGQESWPLPAAASSELERPIPGIDFGRPAAQTPAITDQQSSSFSVSEHLARWEAYGPATEFPSTTAPGSAAESLQAGPLQSNDSAPETAAIRPDQSAHVLEEPEVAANQAAVEAQAMPTAFVADLEPHVQTEAEGQATSPIADVTFETRVPSQLPNFSVATDASSGISSYVSSHIKWTPPEAEPPRPHSRWLAPILLALIACAAGSGWLYYTGRTYWLEPLYVVSRVSSLVSGVNSSVAPRPVPQASSGSSSLGTSSAQSHAPHSSAGQAPFSTAPPVNGSPRSSGVRPENRSLDALKLPSEPQVLKRLPGSPPRPNVEVRQRQNESSVVEDALRRGNAYFVVGKYDAAIRVYGRALKQSPGNRILLERIARARRAKAAEAEFLGH